MRTGEPYRHEPHSFVMVKRLPWPVCRHCGLVRLHNPLTEWCVKSGCHCDDHPDFKATVRRLTRR